MTCTHLARMVAKGVRGLTRISSAGNRRMTRGFTLLELMVALTVMVLIAGLAVPFVMSDRPQAELWRDRAAVVAALHGARNDAIAGNRESRFVLNVAERWFAVPGTKAKGQLDDRIAVSFVTARSEQLDGPTAAIRFFPDGGSTGGRITLGKGAAKSVITVDWLTGRTKIDD